MRVSPGPQLQKNKYFKKIKLHQITSNQGQTRKNENFCKQPKHKQQVFLCSNTLVTKTKSLTTPNVFATAKKTPKSKNKDKENQKKKKGKKKNEAY